VSSAAHEYWGVDFAERATLDVCDFTAFVFHEEWSASRVGYNVGLVWQTVVYFAVFYDFDQCWSAGLPLGPT